MYFSYAKLFNTQKKNQCNVPYQWKKIDMIVSTNLEKKVTGVIAAF